MVREGLVVVTPLLMMPALTLTVGILIILVQELWFAAKMAHVNRIHRLVQKYDYSLVYNIINALYYIISLGSTLLQCLHIYLY